MSESASNLPFPSALLSVGPWWRWWRRHDRAHYATEDRPGGQGFATRYPVIRAIHWWWWTNRPWAGHRNGYRARSAATSRGPHWGGASAAASSAVGWRAMSTAAAVMRRARGTRFAGKRGRNERGSDQGQGLRSFQNTQRVRV